MGHQLTQLGSASLDVMGGLITFCKPQDLPEGASGRNWDVDFEVGSVKSRPGLSSFFTYANTLQITSYSLVYGTATFGYIGSPEPVTNEGFFLSGFSGNQSYLNGLEVFVETVGMTSFTCAISHADDGPITLTASAVSSTGIFVGPNVGSLFTGASWNSPSNISSAIAYASVVTGAVAQAAGVPSSAANIGVGRLWVSPANAITTGASFATSALLVSPNNFSDYLMVNFASLGVPSGAIITGLVVGYKASYAGTGTASMTVDIQDGNFILGTPMVVPMSNATAPYSKGSPAYLWGTGFTSTQLNSGAFGVSLKATTSGAGTVSVNSVTLTAYYTASATSGPLLDQGFAFAVALTSGVSGFSTTFKAFSSASTSATLQLLLAGLPVGTPKSVVLNITPTVYTLGGPEDLWGTLWSAGNVNSTQFGVQITASGTGTTSIGDLDVLTYITPALENFNWVGSYEQNNMALTTLALDAAGNLWKEDVINNPGVLSLILSGLMPNSFAEGATMNNQEFLMFSDLNVGTDRPRLYTVDGNFYPVTQVGPGVAPMPQATTGSISGTLSLTTYSQAGQVGTFTFTTVAAAPTVDSLYVISGTGTALDQQTVIVLGGSTVTTFTAKVTGTTPNTNPIAGTATPQFFYAIASITQQPIPTVPNDGNPYVFQAPQLGFLLGSGPGQGGTGTNVTVWYNIYGHPAWPALVKAFNNSANAATYIQITGAVHGSYNFNGIWQVTNLGTAYYPGTSSTGCYLCFTYFQSGSLGYTNIAGASIFLTQATMTLATPVDSLPAGTQFTITGATPTGWNNTWTISQALNGGIFNIQTTGYVQATNIATYQYQQAPNSGAIATAGQLVKIQNCTNNAAFNGTFVILSGGATSFTVNLVAPLTSDIPVAPDNQGTAVMFGTQFTFDPGETFYTGQSSTTNVNYGTDTNTGQITIIGSNFTPIGAGTRQIACFFITASGNWTPASPPFTFTVPTDANLLNISGIPIGPPDTVGRGIMITEAGQNGVPGANFYVITVPVTLTVGGVTNTYTSTIINDNTSTTAAFSFTDAVLLNSQEVDIPGFNLFNLIEIGSCAWSLEYSNRMFYGLQLNKVMNFNNLTFDGGYTALNQPAGWGLQPTGQTLSPPQASEISLVNSPVTGSALYIRNSTGSIQTQMGMMFQSAYQDPYLVAIIQPNTSYSVRVAASCPSGIRLGNLVIDLTPISGGAVGKPYGSFTIPLSGMTTLVSVFSGVLLPKGIFTGVVDPTLNLRVWVQNMGIGADVLIDRIEVFPTAFPFLKTTVYGSYIGKPESVDASGDGGIIDTSIQNAQPVMGAFVLRDSMYLLKTSSIYVTKDNPNSEPAGWSLDEVSSQAGACGINAFDTGEEWAITGCRNGLYGFDGGKVELLNLEVMQVWNAINWDAGNSLVVRNDTENRRIYCAIPLPTGTSPQGVATATTQWLPYAEYNPAPTTPNVILMLNYQDIGSFQELMADIGTHSTMFGTLANPDMRRKWTIWQIPTPYIGTVLRGNYINNPVMICNGISSSKIYELDPNRHDDDGAAIWSLYTTYSFVNAVKAATIPLFGMHAKRYTVLQATIEGAGLMQMRILPNVLDPRYPYKVPIGINLVSPAFDDAFRSINVKAQRAFLEFSTNAIGAWFQLHKCILTGKQDPWSSLNPTGGLNNGIQ